MAMGRKSSRVRKTGAARAGEVASRGHQRHGDGVDVRYGSQGGGVVRDVAVAGWRDVVPAVRAALDAYKVKSGKPMPYRCRDCKRYFSASRAQRR